MILSQIIEASNILRDHFHGTSAFYCLYTFFHIWHLFSCCIYSDTLLNYNWRNNWTKKKNHSVYGILKFYIFFHLFRDNTPCIFARKNIWLYCKNAIYLLHSCCFFNFTFSMILLSLWMSYEINVFTEPFASFIEQAYFTSVLIDIGLRIAQFYYCNWLYSGTFSAVTFTHFYV